MKVVLPFVRGPYNYDRDHASVESGFASSDESLTQQSEMADADINTIVRRFGVTGELPQGVRMPTYGDFTGVGDFREALAAVESARASFMQMPAEVRSRFENDPGAFVDYCSDPANFDEAVKLGLVVPHAKPPLAASAPLGGGAGAPPGGTVSSSPSDAPKAS